MNSSFKDQFKYISEKGLPGEDAHLEVLPINRPLSSYALKDAAEYRNSAVGIILFEKNQSIHTTLIQRSEYDGTHSKQIAFPGGKMDHDDHDLEYTARRECFEEINLPIGHGELITSLTDVYIPVSKFKINPFVFYLDNEPNLEPNPREVESIFSFDIFELTKEETLKRTDIHLGNGLRRKDVPYFDINGKVVWGATAMMLAELKAILKSF